MEKEDKKVVICDLWSPKNGEVNQKKQVVHCSISSAAEK